MATYVKVCKDAIGAYGKNLLESEADPLTVDFMGKILVVEQLELVILYSLEICCIMISPIVNLHASTWLLLSSSVQFHSQPSLAIDLVSWYNNALFR